MTRVGIGMLGLIWAVRALNSCRDSQLASIASSGDRKSTYFAEVDTFDSFASKRGTNGRTRRCLACANDELDHLVLLHRPACHLDKRAVVEGSDKFTSILVAFENPKVH